MFRDLRAIRPGRQIAGWHSLRSVTRSADLLPILESWSERRKKLRKYRAAERSFRLLVGRLPRDMAVFTLTSG
jgi:hypothetical protein